MCSYPEYAWNKCGWTLSNQYQFNENSTCKKIDQNPLKLHETRLALFEKIIEQTKLKHSLHLKHRQLIRHHQHVKI